MTTTLAPALGHGPMTQQGVGTTPGYDAIDLRRADSSGLQAGVIGPTDFKVVQRGAGANMSVDVTMTAGGIALVSGASVAGQGLYTVAVHTSTVNEAVTTAHATLPRIDQVVLEVKDTQHDASGSNLAQTRVVAGTASSGATLDNRTGAAALTGSVLLLADVLVPAASSSVTTANIRDRRPWARGAFYRIVRNSNDAAGNDYSLATGGAAALIGTTLQARIECSGVPLLMRFQGRFVGTSTGLIKLYPFVDGAGVDGQTTDSNVNMTVVSATEAPISLSHVILPAAGSHLLTFGFSATGSLAQTLYARATIAVLVTFEELVRQNANNG